MPTVTAQCNSQFIAYQDNHCLT